MKITIRPRATLQEQQSNKPHIYQCNFQLKLRSDADREILKTDIRAIKGVTIVTTVPQSEKASGGFSYQMITIKFQPYDMSPIDFIKSLSGSLRKLTKRGLVSYQFHPGTLKKVKI